MSRRTKTALTIAAVVLMGMPARQAEAVFTVELTRFGGCIGPGCVVEIPDNSAMDSDLTPDVINFNVSQVGILNDGVFSASGIATQTFTGDPTRASSIAMILTDATIQGIAGGIGSPATIAGQIGVISGPPLVSLNGVSGFASLNGQYRTFPGGTGTIGNAQLTLQARVGGLLLGFVDAGPAGGLASPASFSGFDARSFPDIPVDNLLLGVFNFDVGAGDGFVLPGSGDVSAIPEPSALLSLALGLMLLTVLGRKMLRR